MSCRRLVLGFLLGAVAATATLAEDAASAGVAWVEDWGGALKQAKGGDKLLMVDFYTSWCKYCKTLDREAFVDPRVVDLSKDFVCAKLDAEVAKAATMRYAPEGFPTIIFGSPTGDEIIRVSGYRTADQIYAVMKAVHEAGPQIAENMGRLEKNRKDSGAHLALGEIYLALGLPDRAATHFEQSLKAGLPASDTADRESDEAHAMHGLARAQAAEKDYKKATKTLDKLLASHPASPECTRYFELLEQVYNELGKPELAAKARAQRESLPK